MNREKGRESYEERSRGNKDKRGRGISKKEKEGGSQREIWRNTYRGNKALFFIDFLYERHENNWSTKGEII